MLGDRHENIKRVNELSAQLRAQIETSEELEPYAKVAITSLIDNYLTVFHSVVENRQVLWYINAAFMLQGERINTYTEEFSLLGSEMADENIAQARSNSNQTFSLLATILIVLLIAFLVMSGTFSRQITQPIIQLTDFTRQVEMGNLEFQATVMSGDEIGELALSFNNMTNQMRDLIGTLEQRVADRTKALATSAEVTRRLATVRDPRQLVSEVVNRCETPSNITMPRSTCWTKPVRTWFSKVVPAKLARPWWPAGTSVPKGRGLVGRAADANASVLVPDVSQEEGWLPNELLPETKAETAIPISVGNQVLGVLDVQHNIVDGLTAEDVTLLESLAGQVAITLQNARSYEQSRSQAEMESLVNVIGQKIQRATTMEDTLQTAIRELGTAIGASRVRASLHPATSAVPTQPVSPVEPPVAVIADARGCFRCRNHTR